MLPIAPSRSLQPGERKRQAPSAISAILGARLCRGNDQMHWGARLVTQAVLFLFTRSGEISPGKLILGFASGGLVQYDHRQEFNQHNLVVDRVDLASTLSASVLLLLVFLHQIFGRWKHRFARHLIVPVPHLGPMAERADMKNC